MIRTPVSMKPILVPLHAWIGLSVLLLTVLRIIWRLTHPKPAYPAGYKRWELNLAAMVQLIFYVLMIALPVLGYLILSSNPPNPARQMLFWGVIPIPYPDYLQQMDRPSQIIVHDRFVVAHAIGSWMMVATLALHLAGVVKHQIIDRSDILRRIMPSG